MEICLNCMRNMGKKTEICPYCGKRQPEKQKEVYELPLGFILHGRYAIGLAIGSGGFGITYAAYDIQQEKRVAVKEYFPEVLVKRSAGQISPYLIESNTQQVYEKFLNRFLDEAQMLYQFRENPHIVSVYHLFRDNNTAYFAMEFLDGKDWRTWVTESGRLEWRQISSHLYKIMDTLEMIHKNGFIHRDIAPDNLFLCGHETKLIDFGAARYAADGRNLTRILKPGYAPPEQYRITGQGPWTDVYALCATIYCCLTGVTPVDSQLRTDLDTAEDILVHPSQIVPSIPQWMDEILWKGMNRYPQNRYQSMAELKQAFLEGERLEEERRERERLEEERRERERLERERRERERLERIKRTQTGPVTQGPTGSNTGVVVEPPPLATVRGARLTGRAGCVKNKVYVLKNQTLIGRDASRCQVVLPAQAGTVSRVHCQIRGRLNFWKIRDEHSTHGTWLNGMRLKPGVWYKLKKGDSIELGPKERVQFLK